MTHYTKTAVATLTSSRKNTCKGEMYLHTIPLLLLTESQSDRFFWNTLKDLITAEIYLDDQWIDLDLVATRPYSNQMCVALTEKKTNLGVFLPISCTGRHFLRTEWLLRLSGSQLEDQRITHIQTIDIEEEDAAEGQIAIFSIAETWGYLSQSDDVFDEMDATTRVGTDMTLHRNRVNAFSSARSKNGSGQVIMECVQITKSACFYKPPQVNHRANAGV